jgi:hypothetical protein
MSNVRLNVKPCMETGSPEEKVPSELALVPLVTVCDAESAHFQVTVSPTKIVMENIAGSTFNPQGMLKLAALAGARRRSEEASRSSMRAFILSAS